MSYKTRLLRPATNDRGLVLLVTVIMIFILLIMAITFFAMASYETRQSTYREESSEAFYLADAGVERTRGELLDDGKWRANLFDVALGNGTYDLYVTDSTYAGDPAIYIYAEGHVDRADRAIEVWAEGDEGTPPLWAGRNIDGDQGNLCLDGWAHANVDADFGNNDSHLNNGSCDGVGDYSDGSEIKPPIMYTEPANYPGATYYFVNYVNTAPPYADILDAAGNVLNLGDDLSTQIKVTGSKVSIEFVNDDIDRYFNPTTGIFRPLNGDTTVVLNFAEKPLNGTLIPNPGGYVQVDMSARDSDPSVNAMIINTHYKGTSGNLDDRWKTANWEGGTLTVGNHLRFEPKQAISALVHQLDQSQAGVEMGTEAYPAMTYVTGSVDRISGDFSVFGALMALNDIVIRGGIQITFVDDFEEAFPPYLQYVVFGQAVALDIFVWREVPASTR